MNAGAGPDQVGMPQPVKYCSECGSSEVHAIIPDGDERPRNVCSRCGQIFYVNPKLVVAVVPMTADGDKVLLCRRAIPPEGWTIPSGFMEMDETSADAGVRETLEEAGAQVTVSDLLAIYQLPFIGQVQLVYRGEIQNPSGIQPGLESHEVGLFPWDEAIEDLPLAFSTVSWALQYARDTRHLDRIVPQRRTKTKDGHYLEESQPLQNRH